MNVDAISTAIRTKFKADVEVALSLPTHYDNKDDFVQPENASWVRLHVLPGEAVQADCGQPGALRYRIPGIFIASVMTPFGAGAHDQLALADRIVAAFKTRTIGTQPTFVTFKTPTVDRIGRSGKWWQVNVTCPWYSDFIA